LKDKNILILTYWSFKDALIQTYTLPYVRLIRQNIGVNGKIFLLTLEQHFFKMSDSDWKEEQLRFEEENIILIRCKYDRFGLKMMIRILALIFTLSTLVYKEKISFIHSWCTPAGALGYLLSAFTKKPTIIDSYEPHAESMVENGTWERSNFRFKLLFWLEKKQSQKAKTVIALTEGMKSYAKTKYNVDLKKYFVKPALVDLKKFNWEKEIYQNVRREKNIEDKIVCVYAGKLGGIYLDEEVFDFFKVAHNHWGDKLKIYLLTDKNINEINSFIKKKDIPKKCIETFFVNHKEIQAYYQIADFAINPVKPVSSKRYCTSIKDGEYWAMGLPIVITKGISDDSDIIEKEDIGYVLKDLTNDEYVNACCKIDVLINGDKVVLNKKITGIAKRYRSYTIAEKIYKEIYS
jgi:glycosyltransferase involved in cell wall biosynthesis